MTAWPSLVGTEPFSPHRQLRMPPSESSPSFKSGSDGSLLKVTVFFCLVMRREEEGFLIEDLTGAAGEVGGSEESGDDGMVDVFCRFCRDFGADLAERFLGRSEESGDSGSESGDGGMARAFRCF